MRTRKPYFAGSIPTAPLYWFLPQSLRYIGAGVWSYVSGFLAELHSSIWRLWPCILAILRDKITSLIGNLLHNFKFLFLFYPWSAPGAPLRPGLHHSHSCIAACPYHLAKIHDGLWIRGGSALAARPKCQVMSYQEPVPMTLQSCGVRDPPP